MTNDSNHQKDYKISHPRDLIVLGSLFYFGAFLLVLERNGVENAIGPSGVKLQHRLSVDTNFEYQHPEDEISIKILSSPSVTHDTIGYIDVGDKWMLVTFSW